MERTDAEVALVAALAGSAVVARRYGTHLDRIAKSATDFATDADVEAERAILAVLRAERPSDGVVGEELGSSGAPDAARTWLVDPLCGTLNFAARTPLLAVNVALRDGGEVQVAAVADPLAAEAFWTDGLVAAWRHGEIDEPLQPSARSRLVDVNLDAPSARPGEFDGATLLADPDFARAFGPRVVSTTLAVSWVAAGRRAAYVTAGQLQGSVHFAAGIAVCQAAGCIVTGLAGQPLHTGVEGLVAAADGPTHTRLLELVGRQLT